MAQTIEYDATAHAVHAVTVFQVDRAEVQRRIQVELKAGQNEVVIRNLPSCLNEDSIRVDGVGSSATIFDVVYSLPDTERTTTTNAKLEELEEHLEALHSEEAALSSHDEILEAYGKTLHAQTVDPKTLANYLDFFLERKDRQHKAVANVRKRISAVKDEIAVEEVKAKGDKGSRKRRACITIIVLAEAEGPAELSLSYAVRAASWTPLYDVRARIGTTNKDGAHGVLLNYRANILQMTGEDWTGINLTLSTASPQIGSTIPTLTPYTIGPPNAPPPSAQPARMRTMSRFLRADSSEDEDCDDTDSDEESLPQMLKMHKASVTENAVAATFGIEGKSNIPSDGAIHKVSIGEIELSDVIQEWVAVPKAIESVFLQCKVKNTSSYPLLPGQANVYLGNSFVAKSEIEQVAPQESFTVSLGVDASVRIVYHPLSKHHGLPTGSLFSTPKSKSSSASFRQRITIKNARSTPLTRVVVRDQVPVSNDARVKVVIVEPRGLEFKEGVDTFRGVTIQTKGSTAGLVVRARHAQKNEDNPSAGDTDDGRMEWICEEVPMGETLELTLAWEVVAPVGVKWAKV